MVKFSVGEPDDSEDCKSGITFWQYIGWGIGQLLTLIGLTILLWGCSGFPGVAR